MKRSAFAALADPSWAAPLDAVSVRAAAQLSHGAKPPAPRTTGKGKVRVSDPGESRGQDDGGTRGNTR